MSIDLPIFKRVPGAWIFAIFAGALYFAALAQWGAFPVRLFDADFVHPYLMLRDLMEGGNPFQWNNSAALYAFPDWLFALLGLLPIDSQAAALMGSIALVCAFMLAGGLLIRPYHRLSLLQAVAIYALALIVLRASASRVIIWLLEYGASLYIHTGATLCVMVSIVLARGLFSEERLWLHAGGIAALGAATIYSDPLYLAWFTAPLLATGTLVAVAQNQLRPLLAPLGIAVVHGLAFGLERIKPFPSHGSELFTVNPLTAAAFVGEAVREGVTLADATVFVYAAAVPLSVILIVIALKNLRSRISDAALNAQDILLALAILSVVTLPVVFGVIDHASKLRYVIALVYLVPAVLISFVSRLVTPKRVSMMAVWTPRFLPILALIVWPGFARAFEERPHRELISCLHAHGLRDGFADHDYTKPLIFLTDDSIHLAQIGYAARTNFSDRWRSERLDGSPFEPSFVIAANLASEHLAPYGEPSEVISCSGVEIWRYEPDRLTVAQ